MVSKFVTPAEMVLMLLMALQSCYWYTDVGDIRRVCINDVATSAKGNDVASINCKYCLYFSGESGAGTTSATSTGGECSVCCTFNDWRC